MIIAVAALAAFAFFALPKVALAHCPLCVGGAAVGLSLARVLGIDDTITGIWMAAFLGAIAFWTYTAISKKKDLPLLKPALYLAIFATTLWSFYKFHLVFRMVQVFGMDKLTFGMAVGGIAFYLVDTLKIKHRFPYQKIVISLGSMFVLSIAMYILVNFIV